MRIGVIGPTENEIMPFVEKIENKEVRRHAMLNFYIGSFEGISVVAVFSGVCKVNAAIATQILIDRFEVDKVILTGVAGALDDKLIIGDIAIGNEIAYHDVVRGILTDYHPWMEDIYFKSDNEMTRDCLEISEELNLKNKCYLGRIVTGEAFISHKERYKIIEDFAPLCVDMESASVAHVCYVNDVPFLVVRAMSDSADENGLESFEENVEAVSLISLSLVEGLIKRYAEYGVEKIL